MRNVTVFIIFGKPIKRPVLLAFMAVLGFSLLFAAREPIVGLFAEAANISNPDQADPIDVNRCYDGGDLLRTNFQFLTTGTAEITYSIPSGLIYISGSAIITDEVGNTFTVTETDIATTNGDNQTDGDDNGQQFGGAGTLVTSPIISLAIGAEPTDAGAESGQANDQDNTLSTITDADGDMTVGFGFHVPPCPTGDCGTTTSARN